MATSPSSTLSSNTQSLSSSEIDGRRAQQLIERALDLAERGDLPAAVLSCRQSIALSPQSAQSYSVLGLLLERAGDNARAITAYEKVLQLAPDSLLERESLGRLRVSVDQNRTTRGLFAFDDEELFGDESPQQLPAAAENNGVGSTPDAAPIAPEPIAAARNGARVFEESASTPVAAAPQALAATSIAAPSTQAAIAVDAAAATAPAAIGKSAPQPSAAMAAANNSAAPIAPSRSAMPLPVPAAAGNGGRLSPVPMAMPDWPAKPTTLWQKMAQRPSYYFRAAPLALTSVMSLAFLLWAHNFAASRSLMQMPPAVVSQTEAMPVDMPDDSPRVVNANRATKSGGAATANPNVNANANANASNGGRPADAGADGVVPSNPGASAPSTPGGARPAATPAPASSSPAPTTSATPTTAAPAPPRTPPATGASGDSSIYPTMPQPRLGAPSTPDDTVRIPATAATSGGSGGSGGGRGSGSGTISGGTPFTPGSSRDPGYTRATPIGSPAAPARPESRAASDERAARTSARAGDNDAAIARMSRSIENGGGDTAFRYQQRAQLYMQNGEPNRAINDFNSAIAAYNDMISRGERVESARLGIRASQRGIQLAQSQR